MIPSEKGRKSAPFLLCKPQVAQKCGEKRRGNFRLLVMAGAFGDTINNTGKEFFGFGKKKEKDPWD
ncbi:MAG: hypothetical protein PUC93_05350 [Oscillospiraceae bacterium]|nr:hypothetical protein [Oscillospiraceae bacterium]